MDFVHNFDDKPVQYFWELPEKNTRAVILRGGMTQVRQPIAVMKKRIHDATIENNAHTEMQDGRTNIKRQKTNDVYIGEPRTEDTARSYGAKEEEEEEEEE